MIIRNSATSLRTTICWLSALYRHPHPRRTIHLELASNERVAKTGKSSWQEFNDLKPPASYTPTKQVKLAIWKAKPKPHFSCVTLHEVFATYLKPGTALLPMQDAKTRLSNPGQYTLQSIDKRLKAAPPPRRKGARRGAKQLHLKPDNSVDHLQNALHRAFQFLLWGFKVEFHVHLSKRPTAKHLRRHKLKAPDAEEVEAEVVATQESLDNVHLRPDVILRSLPKHTQFSIEPKSTAYDITWVVVLLEEYRKPKVKQPTSQTMSMPITDHHPTENVDNIVAAEYPDHSTNTVD